MQHTIEDMIETLDDYYLLFLNKFEDVVLLLVKSLVLGLGCSFEIERKVSQPSINFEYNSRVFRHFMNIICKLFGTTIEVRLANGVIDTYNFDSSQAKVKLGNGLPIVIEVLDNDTLSLIYDPQFFFQKGIDIDSVNLNPVLQQDAPVQRTFSMLKKEYGIQEDKSSGKKDKNDKMEEVNQFMEEDYISTNNIYNPFSLYSSEIDFKKTNQGEGEFPKLSQDSNFADFSIMEKEFQKIDLADYYSGDRQPLRSESLMVQEKETSGIKPFFQPGLKLMVPTTQIVETSEEPSDKDPKNLVTKIPLTIEEQEVGGVKNNFKMVDSTEMDGSGDNQDKLNSPTRSDEPSILYHYNLEKSIDFANGSEYLDSVHYQMKEPQQGKHSLADHIKTSLMPRESIVDFMPPALPIVSNNDTIRNGIEKRNTLSDHIKLLMTSEMGQSNLAEIQEEPKEESPSSQAVLFKNDIDNIVNLYKVQDSMDEIQEKGSSEEAQSSPIQIKEEGNQLTATTMPPKTAKPNPLMCSLGLHPQSPPDSKLWPQSADRKPLVNFTPDQGLKKRPTASIELMKQISQAMHNKLASDSFSGQTSPLRSVSKEIFDMTPLEDKDAEGPQNDRKLSDTTVSLEGDSMNRKTKFLANSNTQKPCRICAKVFKMTKMYYFDQSFFCEACYNTASQKLKKKGMQECAGCDKEPHSVLIVKFILANKFTQNRGSLLFTKDMNVQPYYEYLHKYSAMIAKSPKLNTALVLISNNVTTPVTTMAEVKLCKNCINDFAKCCVCKDTLCKQELFKSDSCSHLYCIDCLALIFLKKYVSKTQFTCKGKLCWKKNSLEKAMEFITKSLETIQEAFSRSGVSVK